MKEKIKTERTRKKPWQKGRLNKDFLKFLKQKKKKNDIWPFGNFPQFKKGDFRKTKQFELKCWGFKENKNPDHPKKVQLKAIEYTFILKGEIKGVVEDERVTLKTRDYIVIKPQVVNNLVEEVIKNTIGLTIKTPSDPSDTIKIQKAKQEDMRAIQRIEQEYYGRYFCPDNLLRDWIKKSGRDFLIAKGRKDKPVAFLFFETTEKIKALPFIHKPQNKSGRYLYVSEVGILNKYTKTNILNYLFKELTKQNKGKKGIIWVTGGRSKHDKIELKLIKKLGFKKFKRIIKWEVFPSHFVNDHWIWFKELK